VELVLSCRKCNLKKHSSLPNEKYIKKLGKRNTDYSNVIYDLKKSVKRLAAGSDLEQIINKCYQIITMPALVLAQSTYSDN
jgi:hypothetical protein